MKNRERNQGTWLGRKSLFNGMSQLFGVQCAAVRVIFDWMQPDVADARGERNQI